MNIKKHVMNAHKFGRPGLLEELDAVIQPYYVMRGRGSYTCMLCKKTMKAPAFTIIRMHFLLHITCQ